MPPILLGTSLGIAVIQDARTLQLPGSPWYETVLYLVYPRTNREFLQVSGYVRSADTAGNLPAKDAIVEYSFAFGGKNYRGSTMTDADGFYSLTILVCVISGSNN